MGAVAVTLTDEVRAFNRFYTREFGLLNRSLPAPDLSLPEARVLYELAQAPEGGRTAAVCGILADKNVVGITEPLRDANLIGNGPEVLQKIDAIGNDFLIQDLTVLDVAKDGIRVEASKGVVFRRIRATWTTPSSSCAGRWKKAAARPGSRPSRRPRPRSSATPARCRRCSAPSAASRIRRRRC